MKYSLNWLQEHLATPLPDITTLAREVTLRAFEVEEVELIPGDSLLEIKVLPDRAHDALNHRGMAREIGGLLGVARKERVYKDVVRDGSVPAVRVIVEDSTLCPRYVATRVDGVTIRPTPKELASKIEVISGRSINNIVDITNFVLFDIGQPLHAFDAEKVKGGITVRLAKKGETMTTLDNKALTLDGTELVIADDEAVLALAGIKGGKKAEVTTDTTSIILECANFDPTHTRKTSQKLNIKTDASKRYENGITSMFAGESSLHALALIAEHAGEVKIGETTDVYPNKEMPVVVAISPEAVNRLIGISLTGDEVAAVLTRAQFTFVRSGDSFTVNIPEERLDLRIKEDMIEEIGRHVGYEQVVSVIPKIAQKGVPNKRLYYANKVRKFLEAQGFSEVYTYSFATPGNGETEVLSPVGKDRPFIRNGLAVGLHQSLLSNVYNAPLIGIEDVKIFEIGNVFPKKGEHSSVGIALAAGSKGRAKTIRTECEALITALARELDVPNVSDVTYANIASSGVLKWGPVICEFDLDQLIKKLPEPTGYEPIVAHRTELRYKTLSAYPFIVRDIAIFVPQEATEAYIETLLKKEAGELVVRFSQFDKFQKEGEDRVSYGYRMVFQSFEKTLTDDEVNAVMDRVTVACNAQQDWQVR